MSSTLIPQSMLLHSTFTRGLSTRKLYVQKGALVLAALGSCCRRRRPRSVGTVAALAASNPVKHWIRRLSGTTMVVRKPGSTTQLYDLTTESGLKVGLLEQLARGLSWTARHASSSWQTLHPLPVKPRGQSAGSSYVFVWQLLSTRGGGSVWVGL